MKNTPHAVIKNNQIIGVLLNQDDAHRFAEIKSYADNQNAFYGLFDMRIEPLAMLHKISEESRQMVNDWCAALNR